MLGIKKAYQGAGEGNGGGTALQYKIVSSFR